MYYSAPLEILILDIQEQSSSVDHNMVPPYDESMDVTEKFNITFIMLKRSIKLKLRINTLIYAFYLGKLINEQDLMVNHLDYYSILSQHYIRLAKATFDIFEPHPDQIAKTKIISLRNIRFLSRSSIIILRSALVYFVGPQS